MHGSRVLLSVGLAFGLAIPGSAAMEPQVVVHPAAVASVAGSTVAQVTARKPVAVVSAVFETAADGKVVVEVTSNAKKVQVKYRNAKGRTKVVTRKLRAGSVVVLLPKGATRIKVRALGTPNLGRSPWARAKPKPHDPPAVVTPPSSPPPSSPPPSSPPPSSPPPTTPPPAVGIMRISTDTLGGEANDTSVGPTWSPDGTRVAFESEASNLVPGDGNDTRDIFVKTLSNGVIERISTSGAGVEGDGYSSYATWSPDGTRVAFNSLATNLVPDDLNDMLDVFVKDLETDTVTLASVAKNGTQGNSGSGAMSWSPDGTKLAFESTSTTLVAGTSTHRSRIYIKDLVTGDVTLLVGSNTFDAQSPRWSPDGARIAFESDDPNLAGADGNGTYDVFVCTVASGSVMRAHPAGNGASMMPQWAPDGQRLAFFSHATDLVGDDTNGKGDLFVTDLAGTVTRVSLAWDGSQANGQSVVLAWSPDGTRIAFGSDAANLVPNDTNGSDDVFVRSLVSGAVQRVSTDGLGQQVSGISAQPAWSPSGSAIAFWSHAATLVDQDRNLAADVFVKVLG